MPVIWIALDTQVEEDVLVLCTGSDDGVLRVLSSFGDNDVEASPGADCSTSSSWSWS